jgi:signal transduction histidine kinase
MNELILVVDDEVEIIKLARDYLVRAGFRVLSSGDGVTALAMARHERPDLIVLDLMDQVLSNLVANALRHTHPGGMITLRAVPQAGRILIQVMDNGVGIAPEDLHYIFERFWSSDKSLSQGRNEGGSGLGLAIARQLVQAHGGQIKVES